MERALRAPCLTLGFILLVCWGADLATAFENPGKAEPVLDLGTLVRETVENNPEIKAARHRWEAARAIVPQAGTLPDPVVSGGYMSRGALASEPVAIFGVTQEVPFPGKLGLREEQAKREAERMEADYAAVRLRVIAKLKEAYFDLHLIHKALEIVEKNKTLLMDFEKTAKARYAVGKAMQQDVFRAQVELSRVLDRLAVLEQRRESLHAEINRLLNRPPAAALGTPEEITITRLPGGIPEMTTLAEQRSPELKAQVKGVERGDTGVALAKREYLPDLSVNFSAAPPLQGDPMGNSYQALLGLRVPLYWYRKQRSGVEGALSSREGARQDLNATHQAILFRVKDNIVQAQRAERLIALLNNAIVPQATLALQSAQSSYSVGKVDFLTLLNSLLTLQENELELHGEMVEHEKALARLEETVGGFPQ
jgi:cobalt-zinc-cadmium efflux system outer membrane protein